MAIVGFARSPLCPIDVSRDDAKARKSLLSSRDTPFATTMKSLLRDSRYSEISEWRGKLGLITCFDLWFHRGGREQENGKTGETGPGKERQDDVEGKEKHGASLRRRSRRDGGLGVREISFRAGLLRSSHWKCKFSGEMFVGTWARPR